jgi:hypothetical protein
MTNAAPALRLTSSAPSLFGSGALVETFLDDEGNEWTSVAGSAPSMTKTIALRERSMMMHALGADLRVLDEAA